MNMYHKMRSFWKATDSRKWNTLTELVMISSLALNCISWISGLDNTDMRKTLLNRCAYNRLVGSMTHIKIYTA